MIDFTHKRRISAISILQSLKFELKKRTKVKFKTRQLRTNTTRKTAIREYQRPNPLLFFSINDRL